MKFKIHFISLGILLMPTIALALPQDIAAEISKNEWLSQVRAQVSVPVCKSFMEDESIAAQMTARDITYDKCLSLMPAITDGCIKEYDERLPVTIDDLTADKWGKLLGECIGNNFAKQYLYTDTNDKAL